jgi:hypothetical protein
MPIISYIPIYVLCYEKIKESSRREVRNMRRRKRRRRRRKRRTKIKRNHRT